MDDAHDDARLPEAAGAQGVVQVVQLREEADYDMVSSWASPLEASKATQPVGLFAGLCMVDCAGMQLSSVILADSPSVIMAAYHPEADAIFLHLGEADVRLQVPEGPVKQGEDRNRERRLHTQIRGRRQPWHNLTDQLTQCLNLSHNAGTSMHWGPTTSAV